MSYPSQWPVYEERYGLPVPTLLRRSLRETKSVRGAARQLNLSRTTFYRWARKAGIDPVAETLRAKLAEVA